MAKITVKNQVSGHTQVVEEDDFKNKWSKDLQRRYEIIEHHAAEPTEEVKESLSNNYTDESN